MLQACLNGGRRRDFHLAVPLTAAELAADAVAAVRAGAGELHLHPRGPDGIETLAPGPVAAALAAVRASLPGVAVGLSTHWDIPPGGPARLGPIPAWTALPDYVSVNLGEVDAPEVMMLVMARGIGVEAGIWTVADAERFVALPQAGRCLRVLVEIMEQDAAEGMAVAHDVMAVLDAAGPRLPILLHGYEATVWPLHREALRLGLDGRIGLEDGAILPDGSPSAGNGALIAAAVAMRADVAGEARR